MTYSEKRLGLLFTLVGPGGVGKNALIRTMVDEVDNLHQLPTATTRAMRPNEQQGREHHFVSLEQFQQMIADNALVEWQEVHKGDFYGVPRADIEQSIAAQKDLIADIEVYGATILKNTYPDNIVLIFIAPPSMETLEERMRERGESATNIDQRLQRAVIEMPYAPTCDYWFVNDDMDTAIQTLKAIILAERSRSALLNLRASSGLPRHKILYAASAIVVYNGEILYRREAPHFPISRLMPGELPHEAALRALDDTLSIRPVPAYLSGSAGAASSFVSPLVVDNIQQAHFEQVLFTYIYTPNERIDTPEDWHWIPSDEANLPQAILRALPVPDGLRSGE